MAHPAWVGYPDIKVYLKKRSQMYLSPAFPTFDFEIGSFVNGYNSDPNMRSENLYYEKAVGAAMIMPKLSHRNNFIHGLSSLPDTNAFVVDVPHGADQETDNEINKRVFVSIPTINQVPDGEGVGARFRKDDQEWRAPGEEFDGESTDDGFLGPIWQSHPHETTENVIDKNTGMGVTRKTLVNWIHQHNSLPNVEWFIHQKYGNFTNESFWVEVVKNRARAPQDIDDAEGEHRFYRYGRRVKLQSYFAVRLGAVNSTIDSARPGGYDVVFPIDGPPFIYDHEGDRAIDPEDDENIINAYNYRGYVASVKNDSSWYLKNTEESFRLLFFIMRGKLIIRASFAGETPWVFPVDISSKSNSRTKSRYENFFVRASQVAFHGRGFSFRMNYNPLEFNIYDEEKGTEKEISIGGINRIAHAYLVGPALQIRDTYPDGNRGGYRDYEGNLDDAEGGVPANFTIIPNSDDTTEPINDDKIEKTYGFDYVTNKYVDIGGSKITGEYTSMMIPVTHTSVKNVVRTYFRTPADDEDIAPYSGPNSGFDPELKTNKLFKTVIIMFELEASKPDVGEYTDNISKRFASPIIWRLKGEQNIPTPITEETLDLSPFVKRITYNSDAPDVFSVTQNFNLEIWVPKQEDFTKEEPWDLYANIPQITSREDLFDWIQNGSKEVEIWLGWWGRHAYKDGALINPPTDLNGHRIFGTVSSSNYPESKIVKVFTGITQGGTISETYAADIFSLKCVEKTEILKDQVILNSPLFDGMNLYDAFYSIGTLTGLPESMFRVRSVWARRRILPMGYTFQEPKVKFKKNDRLFFALKRVVGFFSHVMRCDPDGAIVLTDLYYDPTEDTFRDSVQDLPISHEGFVFYVDGFYDADGNIWSGVGDDMEGGANQNPFQRCYERLSSTHDIGSQYNQLLLQSIDRTNGSFIYDSEDMDVASVEDPDVPNFLGYRKMFLDQSPAFGTKEKMRIFKRDMTKRIFTPIMNVSITTYGRPTLRPFDIIMVHHQDEKTISSWDSASGTIRYIQTKKIKYRVRKVTGSVSYEDKQWYYKTEIQASTV